ncbi:MAG TPA: hypothetical protein VJB95_01375 [Candidatus Paceibacterota bacterium]
MFLVEFGCINATSQSSISVSRQFQDCLNQERPFVDVKELALNEWSFSAWIAKLKKSGEKIDSVKAESLRVRFAIEAEMTDRNEDSAKCRISRPRLLSQPSVHNNYDSKPWFPDHDWNHTLDRRAQWVEAPGQGPPFGMVRQIATAGCCNDFVGEGCFFVVFNDRETVDKFIAASREERIRMLGLPPNHSLLAG